MPQEPDETGRIVVSKKVSALEWERTVKNCKKLSGKVPLDKYVNDALKMRNDYLENESPDMQIQGRSKMKELAEDLEKILKDFEGQKEYTHRLEKLVIVKEDELKVLKKVEVKK